MVTVWNESSSGAVRRPGVRGTLHKGVQTLFIGVGLPQTAVDRLRPRPVPLVCRRVVWHGI